MASYLRPRRGKKATAISQAITLKRGEIFFEVPTSGVGTGIGKIKMGDGSTTYSSLPYFASLEDDIVAFTNVTTTTASSNNATYLSDFAPTASIKTNFNKIKQLLFNLNGQIGSLGNDFSTFQSGVSTIVAAVNAKAGTSHAATDAPSAIAATINNISTGITPSGTKNIYNNGTHDVTNYASVYVSVPDSGITPSGTKNITSNGTYDVTNYASAYVSVSAPTPSIRTKSGSGLSTLNTDLTFVECGFAVKAVFMRNSGNDSLNGINVNGETLYGTNASAVSQITFSSSGFSYKCRGGGSGSTSLSYTAVGI